MTGGYCCDMAKDLYIQLRVTQDEKNRIVEKALANKRSVSALLRACVLEEVEQTPGGLAPEGRVLPEVQGSAEPSSVAEVVRPGLKDPRVARLERFK